MFGTGMNRWLSASGYQSLGGSAQALEDGVKFKQSLAQAS